MASLYLREDLADVEVGARLSLTGAEAKHAATVNRTRPWESVLIGNGRGLVASGDESLDAEAHLLDRREADFGVELIG